MKSAAVGLVISFGLHAIVLLIVGLIESGKTIKKRIADELQSL